MCNHHRGTAKVPSAEAHEDEAHADRDYPAGQLRRARTQGPGQCQDYKCKDSWQHACSARV
eukprot:8233236-Alexandrium_andersonii.AAC.1